MPLSRLRTAGIKELLVADLATCERETMEWYSLIDGKRVTVDASIAKEALRAFEAGEKK